MLRQPREQGRPVARQPGLHHELVLIDQSQLRQRHRELHATREQSLTRFPLELLNGLSQIPAPELRVPIDPVQGARHDVLLFRVDRPGEGLHPIRPRSRPRRRPEPCLHHFVSHPAKEQGIGPIEVLDRVTVQVFVRGYCTMIAAPVQCDVDGIPKGSHRVLLKRPNGRYQPWPKAVGCMPELYARLLRMYIGATCMTRLSDIVRCDPDVLGGMPVFAGTRVPIQSLFDYLEGGETLDEFLRQFPSVKRDQTIAALDLARATLLAGARSY